MNIYYYNGTLWKDVTALDSSFCEETIDRFNRISLDFVIPSEERVPELCHVTWRGEEYTLYTAPKVVKVSTREYRYTLILEGRYKELERVLVKDKLGRTKFVFTGRADQYADLISGCIDGWSTGTCTTSDRSQVIAFSNNSLLDACRMVASKFETEVQLDGGKIAFGRVEKYKGDPLTLAYRQGLQKEITTEPDSKETALGRLYVMGGDRNIDPAKYGSRTLHLPKGGSLSVEGHTFRVDAAGRYISLEGDTRLNTSERALDATTIYPKRVGTISKVEQKGDEWDVIDETNPIDYTQHRVGGDVMRLEFQSGRLAGRSFDLTTKDDKLTGYVHAEKRFRLVRREIDGVLMPEPATFFPAAGDKYAIFGCSLPDEYVASAEAEMLSTGARYMAERLEARVQYRAELDGLWAKKNWSAVAHKLTIGTIVQLEGTAKDVRISSVRTSLNSPYTPRITFSNAPYMVGSLTTQIATIESAEVRTREETRQSLLSLQARTYEDTKVVREMIERLRVEGFTQAIKPETLQSMYAVIGSPALQFDFVRGGGSVPFSWSEDKGGTITIPGQSIRRKASGTTLEPGDKSTITDIPALTYTLKAEEQQAYVYTELSPAPHFVISTKTLAISTDRLLVGLLNGEEGKRAFTPLYGFTEITPGQLKTDLIRSQDGKSYWDLISGKFATTGDLLIGDPTGDTCLAYIDGVLYVKGLTVNVGSSSTTIEDALLEQERKAQKAYDDAVKRAKELDSEIQVGGRNLVVMSRMIPGYLYGEYKKGNPGDKDYKVMKYKDFVYDPTYYEWDGATPLTFKLHKGGKSVPIIHYHDKDKVFIGWSFDWTERPAGYTKTLTPKPETAYIRIGFPCSNPVVKIERGTVATDWTPAPEDIQEDIQAEIDAINANPPRINAKGTWEVYVPKEGKYIDTGRTSKGDNGKAPIVKDGNWWEYDPAKGDYTDTGVKAIGEDAQNVRPNILRVRDIINPSNLPYSEKKKAFIIYPHDKAWRTLKASNDDIVAGKSLVYSYTLRNKSDVGYDVTHPYNRRADGKVLNDLIKPGETVRIYMHRTDDYSSFILNYYKAFSPTKGYIEVSEFKVEEVREGELPIPTAYIPHPDDLKGDGLEVIDTRADNQPPSWYRKNYPRTTVKEFKSQSTIKIPSEWQSGTYCTLETTVRYSDTSGGRVEQSTTLDNGVQLRRVGTADDTAWEPWINVSAEIAAAKEQATKAQTSTDKLRGYVDGAFRDGVVDDAEAKAIKTYINEVDAQWQSALGAYEKVYTNPLLTGAPKTALLDCKTTLLDCKTTLAGKVSDLTQYIATAIGDGRATTAEVDGVNTRYNAYKVALKDFQKALKEAEDFIRSNGAGGTFLGEAKSLGFDGGVQLADGRFVYGKPGDTVRMTNTGSNNVASWERDKIYILVGVTDSRGYVINTWTQLTGKDGAPGRDGKDGKDGKDGAPGRDGKDGKDGKDGVGADYSKEVKELQNGLSSANTSISALQTAKEEIEKGKLSISDLPKNLKWIYDAFHNGKTQIEGGLILSKYIGLSNSSDKVTSYISGEDGAGAHMLAAGVSSLADQDAVSYINYDGTAKFGGIKINRDSIYIDADETKSSDPQKVVRDRLYIFRGGLFAYLKNYIEGGIGGGIFRASYESGFHSKYVSLGGGGSNYISGGDLTIEGDLNCHNVSPIKASGRVYIDGQTGRYPQSLTHETVSGKWCSTSSATRISESVVRIPIKSFDTINYLVFITAYDDRSQAQPWGRVYKIINQTTTYFEVDMRNGREETYIPSLSIQYLVIG